MTSPLRRFAPTVAIFAATLAAGCTSSAPRQAPAPAAAATTERAAGEDRFVDSVLARMTLAEKFGQLNQTSGAGDPTGPGGTPAHLDEIRRGLVGSVFNVIGADSTRALQRVAVEQSRLHIPLVFGLDVIHGYRTIFPVPLGEAASWDTSLAERSARVAAIESAANGIDWTFAPMVDIARDPRWGRIVEGAGEDPYLGAAFAAARVHGFQGAGLGSPDAIAATVKHFAAYGAAEGGRDYNVADISDRTLRDVYLPPFHAGVCAGSASLMAAFDEIGGVPSHANRHLVTDVLRGEWGFDGMVVSDWTGIAELMNHGVAANGADAAQLALHAGVDMDMVSQLYTGNGAALVASGRLTTPEVDEAVRRVLRFKYRLGLFGDPYLRRDPARAAAATLTAHDRAEALAVARGSLVLLENRSGALPLRPGLGTLAVIGAMANDPGVMIGNWSGQGRPEDAVSVLDGLRRAAPGTRVVFARGAGVRDADTTGFAEAVSAARQADAVLLVVGESPDMSAEASSRAHLTLPGVQQRLVDEIAATGKPVVAVLLNGRPLALTDLRERVPGILEAWFPGIEGGNAIAEALFGRYNPGGKLPATFPRAVGQVPLYAAHKNTGRPPSADNKYSSKYLDEPWTPLYPFGWGLSYTTFAYSAPRLSATTLAPGATLRVSVDVRNSGAVAGDEVVQLYLRDDVGSVTRPVRELRGFQRVTLQPGQSRTVTFDLTDEDLAFTALDMRRVAEPGTFTVFTGGNSVDTQEAHFTFSTPDGSPVALPLRCRAR